MTTKERVRELLLDELVVGDDGYKVWWPSKVRGAFSAHTLRLMADIIDEENLDWNNKMQDFFGGR